MSKEHKLINKFFKINEEITLSDDETDYLDQLNNSLYEILNEEGEVGEVKIREIVLDDLLKNNFSGLISYLSLDIDKSIKDNTKKQLENEGFLKVENTETSDDFFMSALKDELVNDLIMSLKGYERKAEGSKEMFIKKRKALIPTARIDAINRVLTSRFNKIEFFSLKDDNEQAMIINFIMEQIFEQLLEIPYDMCDTQKTMEILTMCGVKLTNSVGLSKDFRKQLFETIKESLKSNRIQNTQPQQQQILQ